MNWGWKTWLLASALALFGSAVLVLLYSELFSALGFAPAAPQGAQSASLDLQTGAVAASTFFALILAVVTWQYVRLTGQIGEASKQSAKASQEMADEARQSVEATRDMAERMAYSLRPMLVPVLVFERMTMPEPIPDLLVEALGTFAKDLSVGRSVQDSMALMRRKYLHIENIGSGPAINVGVTLDVPLGQLRGWSIPSGKAGTRPIAAGAEEIAYQWKEGNPMQIPEASTLTVTYSDMLGHHFQTTARRALHDWHDIQTQQVNEPAAPRDYTSSLP